jgi:hypothetical protein
MSAFPLIDGHSEDPHHLLFTMMWTNNATHTEKMTKQTVSMRTWSHPWGLTCKKLHLDQVYVIFRPTTDITTFSLGDDNTKSWRTETIQLYVRTNPGNEYPLFHNADKSRPLTYTQALTLTPDIEGSEDYWCRTYRPLRDVPICQGINGCTEMNIELIFPTLFLNTPSSLEQIPDYRILKVICHFSAER